MIGRAVCSHRERTPTHCAGGGGAGAFPKVKEWISGIAHWNSNPQAAGQKWEPIRARHSRKFYDFEELKQVWEAAPDDMPLLQCFPDTNPANGGGLQPLSHVNKTNLRRRFNIENDFELMKHIANLHDGELRMAGEETWEMFPAPGGDHEDLFKHVFWHHQTVMEDGAPK